MGASVVDMDGACGGLGGGRVWGRKRGFRVSGLGSVLHLCSSVCICGCVLFWRAGEKTYSAPLDSHTGVWYTAVEGRDGHPGALEFLRLLRGQSVGGWKVSDSEPD